MMAQSLLKAILERTNDVVIGVSSVDNTIFCIGGKAKDVFCSWAPQAQDNIVEWFAKVKMVSNYKKVDKEFIAHAMQQDIFSFRAVFAEKPCAEAIIEWCVYQLPAEQTILFIGQDITEQVKMEKAKNRLSNVINAIPYYIFWKDRNSVLLGCNKAFAEAAQVASPAEIVGKTDYDLPWSAQETERYRADDQYVIQTGKPRLNIEETQRMADGKTHMVLTSKVPFVTQQGEIEGVLGVYADITSIGQKILSAEARRNSLQTYLQTIINNIPHFVFWKDRNSTYLGCNKIFAESVDLDDPQQIVGKTDYDLPWSKEESEMYRADDQHVMQTRQAKLHIEEPQTTLDGKKIVLLTSKVPLLDAKGNVQGVLGIYTDITEIKQREADLVKAKEAAEAADKVKTQFLRNMRHDIRTPLSGIVGAAEFIQTVARTKKVREQAENVLLSAKALLEFMNHVLEEIKIAAGQLPVVEKKFNLRQAVQQIINLNTAAAKEKGLQLEFIYDTQLPLYVMGDSRRIQRIVLELVSNALKFTAAGGIRVTLSLAKTMLHEKRSFILNISVSDSGMGIPADKQEEIFQRFSRLNPAYEGVYSGAGLGLSLVKRFVTELDGEISVHSELQRGTVFTCLLPLLFPLLGDETVPPEPFPPLAQMPASSTAEQKVMSPVPTRKKGALPTKKANAAARSKLPCYRFLVVEDNRVVSSVARMNLLEMGHRVDIAATGAAALDYFKKHTYALVFMDIGLPDMDGYKVTQAMRALEANTDKHTFIVAVTAHSDEEVNQQCIEAGMDNVYAKPLDGEKIEKILGAFSLTPSSPIVPLEKVEKALIPASPVTLPSADTPPDAVIDLQFVAQRMKISLDAARSLLDMFMTELPDDLRTLQKAWQQKNWRDIEMMAHKWRGGSNMTGTWRLQTACCDLEVCLRRGGGEQPEALFEKMMAEIRDVEAMYKKM